MDWEHMIGIGLIALLPGALILFGMHLILKRFFEKEHQERVKEIREVGRKKVLPLRLQAYERMLLYLERINPTNSILSIYKPNMTSKTLQSQLSSQIRSEFEHNMAQQLYISDSGWEALKNAKEETIKIINIAGQEVGDSSALSLSNKIYELMAQLPASPTDAAARVLKKEARRLF